MKIFLIAVLLVTVNFNAFEQKMPFPKDEDSLFIGGSGQMDGFVSKGKADSFDAAIQKYTVVASYNSGHLYLYDKSLWQKVIPVKGTIEYEDVHISKTHIWNELLKKEVSDTIRDTHKEKVVAYCDGKLSPYSNYYGKTDASGFHQYIKGKGCIIKIVEEGKPLDLLRTYKFTPDK